MRDERTPKDVCGEGTSKLASVSALPKGEEMLALSLFPQKRLILRLKPVILACRAGISLAGRATKNPFIPPRPLG